MHVHCTLVHIAIRHAKDKVQIIILDVVVLTQQLPRAPAADSLVATMWN